MKKEEVALIDKLNNHFKTDFKLCDNQFSFFDFENINYIGELKCRKKHYKTKMLEANKLFNLLHISSKKNKTALYVVEDSSGIFVFNLNKLESYFLSTPPTTIQSPENTEFSISKKIKKFVYNLHENLAKKYNIND